MDWHKYASTINTLVVTLAIVISGIWAIIQYKSEATKERTRADTQAVETLIAQQFEAAKPFLQRQLDLCIEASDAAATLASARDANRIATALDRFWELYFGSLHIVENTGTKSVESNMVAFGKIVSELPSDPNVLSVTDSKQRGLNDASLEIAKACRRLIEQGWQSVVPQLR